MKVRLAAVVGASVVLLAPAGCGLGAGPGTSDVSLTVTRDFGRVEVGSVTQRHLPGSQTVMRMLERSFSVQTKYGGGFVESINGRRGDSQRHDWFYYVNGIEAARGAAGTAVHRGDRIWWDLHDWSVTNTIPAVVGSFPEPFVHGTGGRRLPTVLECASDVGAACRTVSSELERVGVPVAAQQPGTGSGSDSLAIVVGTWQDLRAEIAAQLVARGPASSGVYARFTGPAGQALQLLDPQGGVRRVLRSGAGLIAATSHSPDQPTWLITGTDQAGVRAAAAALNRSRLHDRFGLAVAGTEDLPVPLDLGS
jgi:hypothetical protein